MKKLIALFFTLIAALAAADTATNHRCYLTASGVLCQDWTETITGVTTGNWEVVVYGDATNRWWHVADTNEFSVPSNLPVDPTPAVCP